MAMRHPYFDLPTPIVIGHRGSAGDVAENTLPSFERALERGAAILESDVHVTRDGVPVLMHDHEVGRTTEGSGRLSELDLEALRKLDAGYRFTPDGGRSHPYRGRGLRVPTLEEALARFPGARFNLELKEPAPGIVQNTLAVIERADREALTLVTSESDELMAELRRRREGREPGVAVGAAAGDVLRFVRSALDGSEPDPGPMALQVPTEFDGRALITRAFVDHAHAHGLQVHAWTINDPHEIDRLLALGVDGIVTDFPGRVAEYLKKRRGEA